MVVASTIALIDAKRPDTATLLHKPWGEGEGPRWAVERRWSTGRCFHDGRAIKWALVRCSAEKNGILMLIESTLHTFRRQAAACVGAVYTATMDAWCNIINHSGWWEGWSNVVPPLWIHWSIRQRWRLQGVSCFARARREQCLVRCHQESNCVQEQSVLEKAHAAKTSSEQG